MAVTRITSGHSRRVGDMASALMHLPHNGAGDGDRSSRHCQGLAAGGVLGAANVPQPVGEAGARHWANGCVHRPVWTSPRRRSFCT